MQTPFIDIHTHKAAEDALALHSVRIGSGEPVPPGMPLTAGIHPWDAEKAKEGWIDEVPALRPVAIGEIGLDYAAEVDRQLQQRWFVRQLDLAEKAGLPVVIHCVRAYDELLALLRGRHIPAIVHGFTGSEQLAAQLVRSGLYLSFGETLRTSPKTAQALRTIPIGRLFLETDQSALGIGQVYDMAAAIRECSVEELKEAIGMNYEKIFGR